MKSVNRNQPQQFGRVAVLMGGRSAEREISLNSGMAVHAALERMQVAACTIDLKEDVIAQLERNKIDRVFNLVHGRGGEDGVLQGTLETLNIPYTGSGVMASALTMDKLRTKLCWQGHGLATPKWLPLESAQSAPAVSEYLGFPVAVKPSLEGSSIGISKVSNSAELSHAFSRAAAFDCAVYAEQWAVGEEYTVAVLAGEALPCVRLQTPRAFYDLQAKYHAHDTQYHCPCGLSAVAEDALKAVALEACEVVGISGWGRVDLFSDADGNAQLIEVNSVPGMTDHSLVPMAAKAAGIEFDPLVWRILETSCNE